MGIDWQNLAALFLVLTALVYLVWRFWWRGMTIDSGVCPSCAGCSIKHGQEPPLISLEPPAHVPQQERGTPGA